MVTRPRRRWPMQRALMAAGLIGLLGLVTRRTAFAHPLHTTMTRLVQRPDSTSELMIRAFADDFLFVATGRTAKDAASAATPSDSAASRYVTRSVRIRDASGRAIPLRWCGLRRTGEVVWVCVRAHGVTAGSRLENRLLLERFDDQVNVVQIERGPARTTLLFTKQRPVRPLPE